MRKIPLVLCALFVIALLAVLTIAVPQTQAAGPVTLRVGIFSDLSTLNWWAYQGPATSIWNQYALRPLRLHLYRHSDKLFDAVPQAAADATAPRAKEGDKWTITVKLKKGLKWSNGQEVTAKDVAFPANTALELQLVGDMATTYNREYLERVDVLDDYAVKFIWKKAPGIAVWEQATALGALLNADYWAPVVAKAKKALEGVDKNDQAAYAKARQSAQQILYSHVPTDEPQAGPFNFVK